MSTEGTTSGRPLELRCEAIAPWLWRVAWAADGTDATDAERERIAQVAVSRANGALVVLAPVGTPEGTAGVEGSALDAANRALIPRALAPLVGVDLEGLDVVSLPEPGALGDRFVLYAPRGRGRIVMASPAPSESASEGLLARLSARDATTAAHARIEAMLADLAGGFAPRIAARRPALDDGELPVASPDSGRFDYAAEGEGRFLHEPDDLRREPFWVARLGRGGEAFTLRPRVGGKPLGRAQLVLLRATAAEDRGALLRVLLDDEDLGPWRLGDAQDPARTSFDLFRISSDLLAGREELRLEFKLEGRREIAGLRWWFLHEEEPDGTWLTELEPVAAAGGPIPRPDRAADGGLLSHDDELFLRGIELARGTSVTYALPRGERRLELALARAGAHATGAARLRAAASGGTRTFEVEPSPDARRAVALPLAGSGPEPGTLEIANDGDVPLLLLAPKLLR